MNKNHTMQRSHEWQVARKGITPIELATFKKTEQTNTRNAMSLYKKKCGNRLTQVYVGKWPLKRSVYVCSAIFALMWHSLLMLSIVVVCLPIVFVQFAFSKDLKDDHTADNTSTQHVSPTITKQPSTYRRMLKDASFSHDSCPCGLRGCKNRPTPFPDRMSYKATKPGSVCPVS